MSIKLHATRQKLSGKKKIAAIIAIVLALAIGLGGALAFTDRGQNFINRFRGGANPDILLHDDFEAGVNKDVYVENTGETPMIVRVQFAEYLQIGNTPIVGGNANEKLTWAVRLFNTAPADDDTYLNGANDDGALPTENRHIWYMTGNTKIYKPGTGEMGSYEYTNGQPFVDGSEAQETLPASPVVLASYYLANKAALDAQYPAGLWALDTDGYAYWTRALQPGKATNLLLDNVILDKDVAPDDNYYYAIDVRLEATNLTESYLLYSGDKKATPDGEAIIKDAVGVATPPAVTKFHVKAEGAATQTPTSNDFTLTLTENVADRTITLTGIVTGDNLSTNPGRTVWSKASGADWLQTAGESTTVRVVVPKNTHGTITINARPKDGGTQTIAITVNVIEDWHVAENHDDDAEIVNARDYVLPPTKTGDSVDWVAIAKQKVNGQDYYLIVRTMVAAKSVFSSANSNNYIGSDLQATMNTWWTGFSGPLKTQAEYHNALGRLGDSFLHTGSYGGFSSPGEDWSFHSNFPFPLSADEAAEYMGTFWHKTYDPSNPSVGAIYNTSDKTVGGVPLTAYNNWLALTDGDDIDSWLRTPSGVYPNNASYLKGTHNDSNDLIDGSVHINYVTYQMGVRPALWVKADVFA
ncbi:MAG: hypothetical protein LBB67_07245 [Oscillospiraceae bacterium]|nr:hypothetical protein [Oscillospiraceae bacterium]